MDHRSFVRRVWAHLTEYKRNILGIKENGIYNGQIYGHILPIGSANLVIPREEYRVVRDELHILGCEPIKLHKDWRHLNSSQVLCISYFYPFIRDTELLRRLVCDYLGIDAEPTGAEFELETADGSNIDFAVHLSNGGTVYFEIKYTEGEFGTASSPTADYGDIRDRYHGDVCILQGDYLKYYQLVRNVSLSPRGGNSHTVFLLPRMNESINAAYDKGIGAIKNIDDFNVRRVYWEDLLAVVVNDAIWLKYFDINRGGVSN